MPHDALQGRWQLIRADLSGERAPELVVRQTVLEITATGYAVSFAGRVMDRGDFAATAMGTRQVVILTGRAGTNAGRTIRGLFQQVGDRLRICYGLDGTVPPDFTSAPGAPRYLATYRRLAGPVAAPR